MCPWRTIWTHEYKGANEKKIWLNIFEKDDEITNAVIGTEMKKGRSQRTYYDEVPIGDDGLRELKKELNHLDLRPSKE